MRNFFRKLMYGRYGYDQLNLFLLSLCLICWILCTFLKNTTVSSILSVLGYVLILFSLFRSFSTTGGAARITNSSPSLTPSPAGSARCVLRPVTGSTNTSAAPTAGRCCGSPRAREKSPSPAATAAPPSRKKPESLTYSTALRIRIRSAVILWVRFSSGSGSKA